MFLLALGMAMPIGSVHAQDPCASSDTIDACKLGIVSGQRDSLSSTLVELEAARRILHTQLIAAQKQITEWQATFKAWCGEAPNCGRLDH